MSAFIETNLLLMILILHNTFSLGFLDQLVALYL